MAFFTLETTSFVQGLLLGQILGAIAVCMVVTFFIFGDSPSSDTLRPSYSSSTTTPRLSHKPSTTFPAPLRGAVSTPDILDKTCYDPACHTAESLDWFNVLVAQTLAQVRLDALHQGVAVSSLEAVLNGPLKPKWVADIKVTEMNVGEGYPIFSNCRIVPVHDSTPVQPFGSLPGSANSPGQGWGYKPIGESTRLQAQIDVELNDVITLGVETKVVFNRFNRRVATLPVALAVSVVRFSGTLLLSLVPVSGDSQPSTASATTATASPNSTALAFTFDPSYTLSLRTSSLVGSRARITDVPKLAQIIESRVRSWFHDRVVYPRFQQVALPGLWPRLKNARGGETKADDDVGGVGVGSEAAERSDTVDAEGSDVRQSHDRAGLSTDGLRWRASVPPIS